MLELDSLSMSAIYAHSVADPRTVRRIPRPPITPTVSARLQARKPSCPLETSSPTEYNPRPDRRHRRSARSNRPCCIDRYSHSLWTVPGIHMSASAGPLRSLREGLISISPLAIIRLDIPGPLHTPPSAVATAHGLWLSELNVYTNDSVKNLFSFSIHQTTHPGCSRANCHRSVAAGGHAGRAGEQMEGKVLGKVGGRDNQRKSLLTAREGK